MKRIVIISLMLASAVAAFAGYASEDECVLPTTSALDYKGEGGLSYTTYGGCSDPWNEYAICYFGYESVSSFYVRENYHSGTYCTNYGPNLYLYGSETEDFSSSITLLSEYCGANYDDHYYTVSNVPAQLRYFKVVFSRGGSAACGSSSFAQFNADRTDSFSFYDGSTKLSDGATVDLSTKVEKEFTIDLYSVNHLPTNTKDVSIELVDAKGGNVADYIIIDDLLFNDFSTDSSRSGYYNLNPSTATMKVNITESGDYSIYVNVNQDGYTIQRRTLNFHVSDTNN